MNELETKRRTADLAFEYELDASPQEVWRAISVPELRETWLPREELSDAEPVSATPGEEICYRMKDSEPPFLESTVTFEVRPSANGNTLLRIVHRLEDERLTRRPPPAANNNWLCRLRAA